MRITRKIGFAAPLAIALLFGCSSAPQATGPAWVHQPARTVDAGYIIYVGSGEDAVPQRASFKAEGQALQDLANECSFVPKGARVEDHYDDESGAAGAHKSYAKVAVDFQSCEEAKGALDADGIKKLANVAMTNEVKTYQEMMNEPPPAPIAEGSPPPYGAPGPSGGTQVVFVRDEPSFFVMRSQVAWVKQTVILTPAPPLGVSPPPPNTQLAAIAGPSREIRGFEQANPTLRTNQRAWSQVRITLPRAYQGPGQAGGRAQGNAREQRRAARPWKQARPPARRKKKKRWN